MNIRGIRGSVKRTYLRDLIRKKEVGMVCLHEAKCSEFIKESSFYLWGSNEIDWEENGVINNVGGVITMWRRNNFNMSSYFNGKIYSVIEGVWKAGDWVQITIVNVYNSGSSKERKKVWEEIRELGKNQQNRVWCVVEDFNSIRRKEERKSVVSVSNYSREIRGFNDFIENSELLDILMAGRKFTLYKPNGTIKSRIDRILVSREWLDIWPTVNNMFLVERFSIIML